MKEIMKEMVYTFGAKYLHEYRILFLLCSNSPLAGEPSSIPNAYARIAAWIRAERKDIYMAENTMNNRLRKIDFEELIL